MSKKKKKYNHKFEKYKILISARNFHYENFNKWMSYFYIAIGALFVGYTTLYNTPVGCKKDDDIIMLLNIISFLGYICSIFWLWSAKGYYYWNINFITLVNYYEKKILKFPKKERIYFVMSNKKNENYYFSPHRGANISTSKVAIFFSYTVACFWGILLLKNILIPTKILLYNISTWFLLSNFGIFISMFIAKSFFYSKNNHFHDLNITQ